MLVNRGITFPFDIWPALVVATILDKSHKQLLINLLRLMYGRKRTNVGIPPIIMMAYVLSLQAAFDQATHKLKTYGDGKKSLSISLFRQGLTKLRSHVQSLSVFIDHLRRITQTIYAAKWLYVQ